MNKLLVAIFLFLLLVAVNAAPDINGYEAEYECRAGGPNCNVDIVSVLASACQQIITTADSAATISSKLNGASQIICIQPGNYNYAGRITITADGVPSSYKVLRYFAIGDSGLHPVNQGSRVNLRGLIFNNANYWILDRISFEANDSFVTDECRVFFTNGGSNVIMNKLLVEGRPGGIGQGQPYYCGVGGGWSGGGPTLVTFQGGVLRTNWGDGGFNCAGFAFEGVSYVRLVNSELYDWCEHLVQSGHNGGPLTNGYVMENTDFYTSPAFQTWAEDVTTIKSYGGSAANNWIRFQQNRVWGSRWVTGGKCCDGGGGSGLLLNHPPDHGFEYILVKNNLFMDNIQGFSSYPYLSNNISLIGNIFYYNRQFNGSFPDETAIVNSFNNSEVYLNTFIDTTRWVNWDGGSGNEYLCNVMIAGNTSTLGVRGSIGGNTASINSYFDATALGSSNLQFGLITRTNSQPLITGNIVRMSTDPITTCTGNSDDDCYLYRVISGGTTAASKPVYCTQNSCIQQDGGALLQAIRGPQLIYRKLITGAEAIYIAYAKPALASPEVSFCPTGSVGATSGRGVNNDVAPAGIFATDITGNSR